MQSTKILLLGWCWVGVKRVQTSTGLQITRIQVSPYRADNANFRNIVASYRHGTVFAPKQYLHQKEALGMQSTKILSLVWCKTGTNLYGASNYQQITSKLPAFMLCYIGPTMQISETSGLPIAMVPCLHEANTYIKRKL